MGLNAAGQASAPVLVSGTAARIGPGIQITGHVYSDDDLYINGAVEGTIAVKTVLTIGPNATVHADLTAGSIILSGAVQGDMTAADKIDIESTARLTGNIRASRLAIQDGAFVNGSVELTRPLNQLRLTSEPEGS